MAKFDIRNIPVGLNEDMFVMAGPCVIESLEVCLETAEKLAAISEETGVNIIFKSSFDKANRTSLNSFRGPGLRKGMEILQSVHRHSGLPVMTDIHEPHQAAAVADTVDCIQIPAFLCRQTDLLVACSKTRLPISVKKGQFVSPIEMRNAVNKLRESGNDKIMLTERGTFFGYNRLVNDMGGIEDMKSLGCPVVFDVTHSTQEPGGLGSSSGGVREKGPILARAAIAAGANALFIETHPNVQEAKCDAACMMPLDWVKETIIVCKRIFDIVRIYGNRQGENGE
jgi:2-dehydro-3-deoxyphosphooctonate aldolase (KDO 8-P synthase)